MTFLSDIEIASKAEMEPIGDIARSINISDKDLVPYGHHKAKVNISQESLNQQNGKLILVTAISPTPAGEGKTTTSIGLADGLKQIGKKAVLALREPSLGPVFGIKGGAAGGGYAQVVPMEDINLHFTGDFHAIGAAHNLLSAMIDNHIHHGNQLEIDARTISWKRVVDMNDRQLRHIVNGLQGRTNGVPREDGFDITVASEIMAILCLSENITDLKERLGRIIIGYNYSDGPVTASDLEANGAMAVILKDAIKPNLVQTLEGSPAFIHGGPFANIAHGCNSIIATKLALHYGEYAVTEAGFGADLGAEKFIDIKCRKAGIQPDAVVIVATIRALKMHGGVKKEDLSIENLSALNKGLINLEHHIKTIRETFNLDAVVAINHFPTDTEAEVEAIKAACQDWNIEVSLSEVWAKGGAGALDLAEKVVKIAENPRPLKFAYDLDLSVEEKLKHIVQGVYGGANVVLGPGVRKQLRNIDKLGYSNLPICIAKTQYSLSDNAKLLGAPKDFTVIIRELRLSAGAGFIVAISGNVMTMPGLPKIPSANKMDIDQEGNISGLF